MTLLESLIALAIAALVIVGGVEAVFLTVRRTEVVALDFETTELANSLLVRYASGPTGDALPHSFSDKRSGREWRITVTRNDPAKYGFSAADVTADVRITRGALSMEKRLSTLVPLPRPAQ